MLEEVCYGGYLVEQLGPEGGAVYTELCGSFFGHQRGLAEASECVERAGRDVRGSCLE